VDSIQNEEALAKLIATQCPKEMSKWKTADCTLFFDNGAQCTVDHGKMLYRWKVLSKRRCEIQKFRSDEKQWTKTRNTRMKFGSPKVVHSSGQWTKFGLGKNFIGIRNYLLGGKHVETNMMSSLRQRIYIYISRWKRRNSVHRNGINPYPLILNPPKKNKHFR